MTLKYKGVCVECGHTVPQGTKAHWHRGRRRGMPGYVVCLKCRPLKPETGWRADAVRAETAYNRQKQNSTC